jgi:prepilin-type N-terminal cleavage/methylation domain-containing protein
MQWAKQKQSGFTIVELLIVIVVIAILAAITIVAYNGIQNRARASAAQSATSQTAKKIALYAVDHSDQYPVSLSEAGITDTEGMQYTGGGASYCVTVTKQAVSYFQTNTTPAQAGACPGHNNNGQTVITNYITNPSFEAGGAFWGNSAAMTSTRPTTGGAHGPAYLSAERTSASAIGFYSPLYDVVPGQDQTSSMSARYPTGRQALLRYRWYNAAGTEIGSINGPTTSGTGNWQRMSFTQTVPTGAATGRIDIVMNTTGAAAGDKLDIDGVMSTRGGTQYGYADGSTAGWLWYGDTHASMSYGPPQ